MAFTFKIITRGTVEAAMMLEGLGNRTLNMRPAFEQIYLTALDIIDETFDTEGARDGQEKWARLKLATVVWKAKQKLDPRILRAGGHQGATLHEAMTTFRHPDQYVRIERTKIVLAPKMLRGKVHQKGRRDGSIPARPFVRFSERDQQAFAREILRWVARGRV